MKPRLLYIVMLFSLLCLQTASAMHDIQHLGHDHDETCQAYVTIDNNSLISVSEPVFPGFSITESAVGNLFSDLHSHETASYLSRAPPLN